MAEILTPGVINTNKLVELLEKYKIKVPRKNVSVYANNYGIEKASKVKVSYKDKNYKRITEINNPKQFYIEPTSAELKNIKKQYDINRLKSPGVTKEGAEAFELRYNRLKELLKKGKSPVEVKKIIKDEFGFNMASSVTKASRELREEGVKIKQSEGKILKVKDDLNKLNKSEVKDLIRSGETNIEKLVTKTKKILNTTPELAARRIGQLIEAFNGDNRYINAKSELLVKKSKPLIEGLGKVTDTKLYGGIGGGLQRMMAEKKVSSSINQPSTFFSSLRKRIQELIPSKTYEVDEIKNIASSGRSGTGPYSIFLQGIKSNINQEKASTLDKQMSIFEKRIQETENVEEKKEIAKRYNTEARKFVADANKNLKPGQLPVRVLEFSFEEPSKVIKNKNALENYGELFDDIYKKHGYSFKVPSDVKTVDEIRPYLESQKGNTRMLKALAQRAPRIFGIPTAAYLGYQALSPSTAEAKIPSQIQNTETAQTDQQLETAQTYDEYPELDNVYASASTSDVPYTLRSQRTPITEVADVSSAAKVADDLMYDNVRKVFVKRNEPEVKATQSDILYWLADNVITESPIASIGVGTAALSIPGAKETFEAARKADKGVLRSSLGVLGKGLTRVGSPAGTALFEVPFIAEQIKEGRSPYEILSDPLNYIGPAFTETLTRGAGAIKGPPRGILGGVKDTLTFEGVRNPRAAAPGLLNLALRLGLSPRNIALISGTGAIGAIGATALTAYDLIDAYRKGELDNLFSSEKEDTSGGVFIPGEIDTSGIMGLKNET